jgi:integrase
MRDATRQWLEHMAPDWSFTYADNARSLVREWSRLWGAMEVEDVRTLDVEKRYRARAARGLSGSRLNGERSLLRSFFQWARRHELTDRDPVATWPAKVTRVTKVPVSITAEEEEKLLAAMDPELRRYTVFSLYTGLRQGTVRRLTWSMIDAERGWMSIPAEIVKTGKPIEQPMTQKSILALGTPKTGQAKVFPNLESASTLCVRFGKAVEKAGLESRPTPHDLRKTFATRLLDKGVPIATVCRLGGWSTSSTLMKHYLGKLEDQKAVDAISVLED